MSWPSSKSSTSRSQERTDTSLPTISAFQVVPTAALNRSVSARRKLDVFVNKEDGTAGRRDPDCLRLARRPFNSLIECSTAITSSGLQAASAPTTTERRQIKVDRKNQAKVAATADYKSPVQESLGRKGQKQILLPEPQALEGGAFISKFFRARWRAWGRTSRLSTPPARYWSSENLSPERDSRLLARRKSFSAGVPANRQSYRF